MRPAVRVAAARLRVDSATAEVLRALDAARVESILLKGASNRRWLGTDAKRGYADCDLLVGPDDLAVAERVLSSLGFAAELDVARMPAWWREHAVAWTREVDLAAIDLHRTLPGIGVDDRRAWSLLSTGTEQLIVGGYPARVLAVPARAVQAALHAAHHGDRASPALSDLTRALLQTDEGTWQVAAALASDLGAVDAFLAGLRLDPAGDELAARLGIHARARVQTALVEATLRAPVLSVDRFARANGLRTRLSMIRHKLVPPRTFMRSWSPLARRGLAGLLLAYAWRPVWVLTRVPAALRTWRKARRAADSGRG